MRSHFKTVTRLMPISAALVFGLPSLQAYEQGSYLILDIVEQKSEASSKVARLEIEQDYFKENERPKVKAPEVDEVSSEFLAGLEQQKPTPSTFDNSGFGDVQITPNTSTFETSITSDNESTFGSGSSSVFGQ